MITRKNCEAVNRFHHISLKNADGTPLRARRNGRTKTWVTRPTEFRIPIKIGLRGHSYITHNTTEWVNADDKD